MIKKYKKLPVVIEAIQWDGLNDIDVLEFAEDNVEFRYRDNEVRLIIHTLEGNMNASIGDHIIRGVNGEYYACKPDVFVKTYEEVDG